MNPGSPGPAYSSRSQQSNDGDAVLVQRMCDGDERAIGLFYDKWIQPVHTLVLALLQDRDEAEDVVEETFWQVWRQASAYDTARGTVSTWVLTIARSRALDKLRARKRQRTEPLADSAVNIPALSDPAFDAESSEQAMLIVAALKELPDEQREVIHLSYFQGLSQSEIAAHTSQPLGTVKTRMRLGMQKLREHLSTLSEPPIVADGTQMEGTA